MFFESLEEEIAPSILSEALRYGGFSGTYAPLYRD
jgi:hypothetical protein